MGTIDSIVEILSDENAETINIETISAIIEEHKAEDAGKQEELDGITETLQKANEKINDMTEEMKTAKQEIKALKQDLRKFNETKKELDTTKKQLNIAIENIQERIKRYQALLEKEANIPEDITGAIKLLTDTEAEFDNAFTVVRKTAPPEQQTLRKLKLDRINKYKL